MQVTIEEKKYNVTGSTTTVKVRKVQETVDKLMKNVRMISYLNKLPITSVQISINKEVVLGIGNNTHVAKAIR